MQKMNASFENLDLRSLRVLKQLLDLKSVTKAGEALGLSQPAASRVLSQLRITLGDPLLVRGRQGNTLTPRGEELRPAVAEALRSISALFEREVFAPSTAKLIVRIATTDHGATVVLSPLVKMLGTFAPGITLEVTPWSPQTLHELETGRLDLALDSESRLPENFFARTLYRERSVCLVRQGHPLLDGRRKDGRMEASTPHWRRLIHRSYSCTPWATGWRGTIHLPASVILRGGLRCGHLTSLPLQ